MASHHAIGKAQSEQGEERVMGIEAQRLLHHRNGFLRSSRKVEDSPQQRIPLSIVGTEGDSPLTFSDGLLMLLLKQIDNPQYRVGQRQGVIQGCSPLRQGK